MIEKVGLFLRNVGAWLTYLAGVVNNAPKWETLNNEKDEEASREEVEAEEAEIITDDTEESNEPIDSSVNI